MKVNCNRAALCEALQLAASIVPSRTPKPILQCAKLEANLKEKKLTLTATDNEITICYHIPQVEIIQAGATVAPADRLTAILRESSDDTILLEVQESTCQIIGKDSRFRIYGHDPAEFPVTEDAVQESAATIKAGVLKLLIGQTAFAAAKESTRYAINGVLWETHGKKLRLVATDGRRLAMVDGDLVASKKEEEQSAIVPVKTMQLLERMHQDPEQKVDICFTANKIVVATALAQITSNLVQGRFPKYTDVIPTGCEKKVQLNAQALQSAVKRVSLLINEQSRGVQLRFSEGQLCLSSSTPEAGDAEIKMAADYHGDDFAIGFNPQYILDLLRVVDEPDIVCEFSDTGKPGLLRAGKSQVYVIMPVTV